MIGTEDGMDLKGIRRRRRWKRWIVRTVMFSAVVVVILLAVYLSETF